MQNSSRNNILNNIDWVTVIIYVLLVFMGWLNIYSAVYDDTHKYIFDISQQYGKQLLWIGAASFIAVLVVVVDSKFYSTFAYVMYAIGVLLLVSVLFFGREVNGARSWFEVGSIRLQPVEFTKIAVCLAMARLMSSENFTFKNNIKSYLQVGLILGIPILLIFIQNDTGSALVFCTFIFVMYREGFSKVLFFAAFAAIFLFIFALIFDIYKLILITSLLCVAVFAFMNIRKIEGKVLFAESLVLAIATICLLSFTKLFEESISLLVYSNISVLILTIIVLAIIKHRKDLAVLLFLILGINAFVVSVDYIFNDILQPHQQSRIMDLLGKNDDVLGTGYNVHQSKIAIGSGGLTGKGYLQGTQTKYNFVPEQSTDFIFCTIGEEWGFIGVTAVLILFGILIGRLVYMAERQRSLFSRIYGYGVASILFFHVAINIGMTIGLAPVVGIPLPFFSYGGSSLWAFTILVFIFVRLDADRLQVFR